MQVRVLLAGLRAHGRREQKARLGLPRFLPAPDVWRAFAAFMPVTVAVVLPAFFFLYRLGSYPLLDNNEGLYAEVAREMLESGDFILPHLDGVPYVEKPPLLYWLMALSLQVLGSGEAAARLVSALAMGSMPAVLYGFCRRIGQARAGIYAAAILSTAMPVVLLSRTVLFDPLLTALLGFSLLAFLHWYLLRGPDALVWSALALALATLEKGIVAVALAAMIVVSFLLLMRDRKALRALFDARAIAVFVAVALPWHLMAASRQEGFAWFYLVNEHVLRFLGTREPHDFHAGPFYYYLPRLLVMLLPWPPFLALLLRPARIPDRDHAVLMRFCAAWIFFPTLFFTASQAKANYYLLVTAPAAALLIGLEVVARLQRRGERALGHCLGCTQAVVVACGFLLMHSMHSVLLIPNWMSVAGAAAICALVWILSLLWMTRTQAWAWKFDLALAATCLSIAPLLPLVLEHRAEAAYDNSSLALARKIESGCGTACTVFAYRNFEDVFSTLPFYLRRTIKVIDSTSADLRFGCSSMGTDRNACVSDDDFDAYRREHPVAVVMTRENLADFRREFGADAWRARSDGEKLVLFNFVGRSAERTLLVPEHHAGMTDSRVSTN